MEIQQILAKKSVKLAIAICYIFAVVLSIGYHSISTLCNSVKMVVVIASYAVTYSYICM